MQHFIRVRRLAIILASAAAPASTLACDSRQLTSAAFEAIQPEMNIEHVVRLIGCEPDTVNASPGGGWKIANWMSSSNPGGPIVAITVWFDSNTWKVTPIVGNLFKSQQGIEDSANRKLR